MGAPALPPGQVLSYARRVTDRVRGCLGRRLRAAYLHGSAVLGGWVPDRSDVDMLFVAEDGARGPDVDALASVLAASAPEGPGRGLECSVVTVGQASRPQPPWPFLLHVAHDRADVPQPGDTRELGGALGPGGAFGPGSAQVRVVRGDGHPGDPDLLMHYAVCRAAGWATCGPGPRDLIGSVPRPAILGYLADELGWGLEHGTEAYAVLNACRARVFLADGQIVSKIAGGSIALDRGLGPPAALRRALQQQQGMAPTQVTGQDAVGYVRATAAVLRSAADAAAGSAGEAASP